MKDELDKIMQVFEKLSHYDQVGLFLDIKSCLLTQRSERLEHHSKAAELEKANIEALLAGNNTIINGLSEAKI